MNGRLLANKAKFGSTMMKSKILLICIAFSAFACTSVSRKHAVPESLTAKAEVPGLQGVRYVISSGEMPDLTKEGVDSFFKEKTYRQRRGLPVDPMPTGYFLALSGGGDDGAFGAGLLNGWTKSGSRPEFKLVTGISTGALIAPFAFIGSDQDAVLQKVYTQTAPRDILESRGVIAALTNDALADNAPLGKLVQQFVTEDFLKRVAEEYGKGRLLLIATTNLDSRQAVVWNMTKIAAIGGPEALRLFRQVMLASAAIPGAFPPSMITVEADGNMYEEMHVDGGTMAQVFLYPPSLKLDELSKTAGIGRNRELFLIRNSRLDSDWAEVERQTFSIAGRAISSLIQTQGVGDLYRIYAITERDHMGYHLAYIPKTFKTPHKEEFDANYMRSLYDLGFTMAEKGYPWIAKPPDL
jgi:hypothetical protein